MLPEVLKKTLFLDIETVAAKPSYEDLDADWKRLWGKQVLQSYNYNHAKEEDFTEAHYAAAYLKKAAFHAEFSKVACLSMGYLVDSDDGKVTLRVKPITGEERTILNTFGGAVNRFGTLCAHNGKKFDFPFLARRFHANNLHLPDLLNVSGKKPWELPNIDTMDFWRFGDMPFPSLELLCKTLSLDGIDWGDMEGSMVHDKFYKGEVAQIAKYCANDVIAVSKLCLKLTVEGIQIDNTVILA